MNKPKLNIDKYFLDKTITQVVGSNYSNKHRIIALLLLKKVLYTKCKVLYIDTTLSCPISYIQSAIDKICYDKEAKSVKSVLENAFMLIRFPSLNEVSAFFEYQLERLLLSEQNKIKTIVIDNMNTVFQNANTIKKGRQAFRDVFTLSKKYNINIIYINELFYTYSQSGFNLEITYGDIVNEFCSSILYIGDSYKDEKKRDVLISKLNVLKSNTVPLETCMIYIDLNTFSFVVKSRNC